MKNTSFNYSICTTSSTSGINRFKTPSIPDFNVIVEEGHPLQAPFNISFTIPLLKESTYTAPPSISTAGHNAVRYASPRAEGGRTRRGHQIDPSNPALQVIPKPRPMF